MSPQPQRGGVPRPHREIFVELSPRARTRAAVAEGGRQGLEKDVAACRLLLLLLAAAAVAAAAPAVAVFGTKHLFCHGGP